MNKLLDEVQSRFGPIKKEKVIAGITPVVFFIVVFGLIIYAHLNADAFWRVVLNIGLLAATISCAVLYFRKNGQPRRRPTIAKTKTLNRPTTVADTSEMPAVSSRDDTSRSDPVARDIVTSNELPKRQLKKCFRRPKVVRKLEVDSNHESWLVVTTFTRISKGRYKGKQWERKIQRLHINESPFCKTNLALKIPIIPTDSETEIHVMTRRHRWKYGPARVGILLLTIATTGGGVYVYASSIERIYSLYLALFFCIAGLVWYFLIWIKWAYRFLIATDIKTHYPYRPPFKLAGGMPSVDFIDLQSDPQGSSSTWGNLLGYGTIQTDTSGNSEHTSSDRSVDAWLANDMTHIPHYEDVASKMRQLREDAKRRVHMHP